MTESRSHSLTATREHLPWSEVPRIVAVYRGVTRRSSVGLTVRLDLRRPLPRLHTLAWAAGTRLTLPLEAELGEALRQVEATPGNHIQIHHAAGTFAVRRGGRVARVSPPPVVVSA